MELSENYILNVLYSFAGEPSFNKYDGNYNASCPICREGKSWGIKKRLYYYPKTKSFFCFNCSQSWTAKKWIHIVSGLSYEEINMEMSENGFSREITNEPRKIKKLELPSLPFDSINISDSTQRIYYNNNKIFCNVINYIEKRKLHTAINSCKNFYISFTDKIHKNRLVIPFYNLKNQIIFYQTRSIDGKEPRYLGKTGYQKTIFGIERIDPLLEYIFIFEGPIDSMFVKNGVAVCGLTLTDAQKKQLAEFPFHKKIWVLDNISVVKDEETKEKTINLLNSKELVFKWPNNLYKDMNEWAIAENLNEIDYNIILNNLY